jgi:hypothetical protein
MKNPKFEIGQLLNSLVSEYCGMELVREIHIKENNKITYIIDNGSVIREEDEENLWDDSCSVNLII